jgi:hypothetical protein
MQLSERGLSAVTYLYFILKILGIPEADRQKLVSWMEFSELAQYFAVEEIKQQKEGVAGSSPDLPIKRGC